MSELMTETTESPNTDADLEAVENVLFGRETKNDEAPAEEAPAPEPEAGENLQDLDKSESEAEQTDDEKATDEAKKDERSANRFTRQTKELRETQRQLRELQEQLAALNKPAEQKPLTETPKADTDTTLSPPDPAKYQYGELDPQFIRDTARFEAKIEAEALKAELRQERETAQREAAAQREAETLHKTAADIKTAGEAKFEDFQERVVDGGQNGDYALTQEMFETLAEVPDVAPDILYYLASYPDESAKVAQMSPRQQAMWFGRIEAEIRSVAKEPPKPAARKATAAPPPPPAIPRGAGTGGGGVKLDDLEDPRALEAIEKLIFKQKG